MYVDDAFKLTIDKIFVPNLKNFKQEEMVNEYTDKEFPVEGYSNNENMW